MAGNLDLSATLELIDRISAPLRGIQGITEQVSRAFDRTRDAVRNLERQQGQIASFKQLSQQLQANNQKLDAAKQHLEALRRQMAATANPSEALARKLQTAERAVQRLSQTASTQSDRLNELRQKLKAAGISTDNLAQHEQQLAQDIIRATAAMDKQRATMERTRRIQEQLDQQRNRWQNIGTNSTAIAAAGALAMSVPIKAFAEAEDAATQLKVSMMDATGKIAPEFEKINALAERLGTKLPGSTADFSTMMAKLVQQGISFKDILGGVGEASANLAVALKMPFADAAEFAAKMQDATKTKAEDMIKLMDVIQKSFYLGVDSTNMLSGFAKMSAGMKIIRMEGLAGAQAMAPLLVMADQAAMSGESAGNAYSKIFKAMMNTQKIAKSLKGTGIEMNFTNQKGEFGGLDNMFKQLQKLKTMTTEQRLPVLSDMFGDDAETIQALNLLIDKGQAGYKETLVKMQAQADLQKRVNAQLGTLANLWDAAKGTFTSAMVTFGEALAPDIKNIVGWITDLSEQLGSWAKQNPQLAQTLMRIAAVVVVVAVALAGLSAIMLTIIGPIALLRMAFASMGAWSMLVGIVTRIGTALGWLAGVIRAVGIALMTNPLLLAITLLATAAYLIYRNWGPISAFFSAIWASISAGAQSLWTWLVGIWNSIYNAIITTAQNIWNNLKQIFGGGIQALIAILMMFNPVGIFMMAFMAVWSYFSGLRSQFMAWGGNIIEGLKIGIMSRAQAVIEGIQAVAARIKGAFTGMLGIHSPSRVFAEYGDFMMQGLNNGLLANHAPVNTMIRTSDQLKSAVDTSQIRFDSRPPISAGLTAAGQPQPAQQSITINVYAQPHQSEQDIARQVADALARQNTRQTGLYDYAEAW